MTVLTGKLRKFEVSTDDGKTWLDLKDAMHDTYTERMMRYDRAFAKAARLERELLRREQFVGEHERIKRAIAKHRRRCARLDVGANSR